MRVVVTREQLNGQVAGGSVLVPTMGALHAGHGSLIAAADHWRRLHTPCLPVVVTAFVNPTQFNDRSDLARYPRTPEADASLCRACGADVVFAPDEREIYPPTQRVDVPELPSVATKPGLEDAFRPGHFAGVCQVVARLFALTNATAAFFGEKDWQQFKVIESMARRDGGPRIIGAPTVREPDGLAMSSRNVFLSPDDRRRARSISRALCEAAGAVSPSEAETLMRSILAEAGLASEYAVVRRATDLAYFKDQLETRTTPGRALIAARVGGVRLIDNAAWGAADAAV